MALQELIKNNTMIQTAVGMSTAGLLSFWIKDMPRKILNFIKKNLITTMTIHNSDDFYTEIVEELYKNSVPIFKNSIRSYRISDNWDEEKRTSMINLRLGYGNHILKYKNKWFFIRSERDTNNNTNINKESVQISVLGRANKPFESLLESSSVIKDNDLLKVIPFSAKICRDNILINKRSFDTVLLEKEKKEKIINLISDFRSKDAKERYKKNGIPYQLGILLYGPPGTGKTSIISSIASHFDMDIITVSDSESLIESNGYGRLLVVEDIDALSSVSDRQNHSVIEDINKKLSGGVNLSQILNSIDGLNAQSNVIRIFTTNHIDKLDPALIRPGRIDLSLEIGFINHETLNQFINLRFPTNERIDITDLKLKQDITPAKLQELFLQKYSLKEILNIIKEEN